MQVGNLLGPVASNSVLIILLLYDFSFVVLLDSTIGELLVIGIVDSTIMVHICSKIKQHKLN